MAPTILARIAIRLVAIYLLSQGLIYVPGLLALPGLSESAGASTFSVVQVVLVSILPLLLGLALWIGAPPISRLVVGPVHEEERPATAIEIQAVAISTAGLILLFIAVPRLVSSFYLAVVEAPQIDGVRSYNDGLIGMLLGAGLQVLLAVLLIAGARFWPRVLWRIRAYGVHERSSNKRMETDA
jgi:hypothetical protein